MKTLKPKAETVSRAIQNNPNVTGQASWAQVLQKFGNTPKHSLPENDNNIHTHSSKPAQIPANPPIQRKITTDDQSRDFTFTEVLEAGENANLRDFSTLDALFKERNKSYTITEAIQKAKKGQAKFEVMLAEDYAYDSDELVEQDPSAVAPIGTAANIERKTETVASVVMPTMHDAVKVAAGRKRRMLSKKNFVEDEQPFIVDTTGSGTFFEIKPTTWMKDMGAYPAKKLPNGNFERDGQAKNYEALGKDMDKAVAELKITYARANELIVSALLDKANISTVLGIHTSIFGELIAVLLTEMSRGSSAIDLVFEMLADDTPFSTRFNKKRGTYQPAKVGGTKTIREYTDTYKKKKLDPFL